MYVVGSLPGRKRVVTDQCREVGAFDVVHREEVLSLVFSDLVDCHDVRMLQVGSRFGLGQEAPHILFTGQLTGQEIILTATVRFRLTWRAL